MERTSRDVYNYYNSWEHSIDKDCKDWNTTKMNIRTLFFTLFPDIEKKEKYNRNLDIDNFMKENIGELNEIFRVQNDPEILSFTW